MESIDVDFDASTSQVYLIGEGSCAVPGVVAGLEAAHERYGSLPWSRLFGPAVALAREGVELTPQQAYLHAILDLILRHSSEGRAIYGEHERIAGGRARGHARPRPNARASAGGRRARVLRGRAGPRARALPGRQRRPDHAGRPGRVPGHLAAADPRLVCGARVRLEPASVLGRRPRRVRPLAPRPSRGGRPARAARRRSSRSSR